MNDGDMNDDEHRDMNDDEFLRLVARHPAATSQCSTPRIYNLLNCLPFLDISLNLF